MADPNIKPNDNSKSVVHLLIALVAILSLLLFVSLMGIGLLVTWRLNSSNAPDVESTEVATKTNERAEPAAEQPTQQPPPNTKETIVSREGLSALSPLPANLNRDANAENNPLSYKLDQEKSLSFDYSFGINFKENDQTRTGRITYRFLDDDPQEFLEKIVEEGTDSENEQPFSLSGNGTGFVVHPDGLLVTCAHVVEGVDTVSVKLGDNVMPGVVVERDLKHDLALVKVQTDQPLPFLKLASDTPNLGSAARVFGFPLADRLGRSMKLTTGTVTGRDEVNDSTRLQLDATANPGNSGGPVTNNEGVVLGVVDSILAGGNVADLSFAVPVDELRTLLSNRSIPFCSESETENELAISKLDEVSKAVAMVEVSGEQLSRSWKVVSFSVRSRLRNNSVVDMRSPFRIPTINPSSTTSGKMVISSRGKVIYSSESQILPGIVQGLTSIGITELPISMKDKWSTEDDLLLHTETTERKSERARDPFGSPFSIHPHLRRSPFSPFGAPPAREVTRQSIRAVNISNQFEIETRKPKFEIRQSRKVSSQDVADNRDKDTATFRGALTFDPEIGWMESGELKGHVKEKIDGKLSSIRVTYSFRKVTDKRLDAEKRRRDEAIAKAKERRQRQQQKQTENHDSLDRLAGDAPGIRNFKFAMAQAPEKKRQRVDTPRVFARIPKRSGQGIAAISPDGEMVAISQMRGVVLYRVNDSDDDFEYFANLGEDRNLKFGTEFLQFSGDNKRLVVGGRLGKTYVFELGAKKPKLLATFKDNSASAIAVSEDGNRVAIYSNIHRHLTIVDVNEEKNLLSKANFLYDQSVHDALFSADGQQLLVAQGSRSAVVDIEQQKVIATFRWPFSKEPRKVTLARTGKYLVGDQEAFTVATGEPVSLPSHDDDSFAFCGAGEWFVHIAKKFDKNIQFHKVDGATKYQLDAGAKSGHWDRLSIAADTNRAVAFETFSDSVFVIDF